MHSRYLSEIIALAAIILFCGSHLGSLDAVEKSESIELEESRYPNGGDLYMRGRYLTNLDGARKRFGPWHYYSDEGTMVHFHGEEGQLYAPTMVISREGYLVMVGLQQADGTKNGPEVDVYPESQKIRTITSYKSGMLHGPWIYFGIDGNIVSRKMFSDGKVVSGWSLGEQGKDGEETQVIINGSGSIEYIIRGMVKQGDLRVLEEYVEGELRKVSTTEVQGGKVNVSHWVDGKWESMP